MARAAKTAARGEGRLRDERERSDGHDIKQHPDRQAVQMGRRRPVQRVRLADSGNDGRTDDDRLATNGRAGRRSAAGSGLRNTSSGQRETSSDNPWRHQPRGPKKTHELSTRARMAKASRKANRRPKSQRTKRCQ